MNNTEDIRKKEKKLNREHWMCRVQMYTFGIDAPNYYMGYCPFFWMTWVSLLVLPIVFLGKTFVKLTSILIRPVTRYIDTRAKAREAELIKTPLEPTYNTILDVYGVFGKDDFVLGLDGQKITLEDYSRLIFCYDYVRDERFRLWFLQNPNWRDTHLEKARAERQRVEGEERERRKKREARNRKLSNVAGLCGRGLFKLLIPTVIIALGALAYYGIIKLCSVVELADVVLVFSIIGFIVAGFLACRILGDFLSTFVFTEPVKDKISRVLGRIFDDGGICDGLTNKIRNVREFIIDTVALTYKAECPLILWGDETGNITRRNKSKNK
jgi:hypothetical protein